MPLYSHSGLRASARIMVVREVQKELGEEKDLAIVGRWLYRVTLVADWQSKAVVRRGGTINEFKSIDRALFWPPPAQSLIDLSHGPSCTLFPQITNKLLVVDTVVTFFDFFSLTFTSLLFFIYTSALISERNLLNKFNF